MIYWYSENQHAMASHDRPWPKISPSKFLQSAWTLTWFAFWLIGWLTDWQLFNGYWGDLNCIVGFIPFFFYGGRCLWRIQITRGTLASFSEFILLPWSRKGEYTVKRHQSWNNSTKFTTCSKEPIERLGQEKSCLTASAQQCTSNNAKLGIQRLKSRSRSVEGRTSDVAVTRRARLRTGSWP